MVAAEIAFRIGNAIARLVSSCESDADKIPRGETTIKILWTAAL